LQVKLQNVARHFYKTITSHSVWDEATDEGILDIPNAKDYESNPYPTHILSVMTRQRYNQYLYYHLQLAGFVVLPINYPVVPKGLNRIRIVFHARHTNVEVEGLANSIAEFAQEMLDIEAGRKGTNKIPSGARRVFAAREAGRANGDLLH
jgi:8-amino-7-oxononanoate synthase